MSLKSSVGGRNDSHGMLGLMRIVSASTQLRRHVSWCVTAWDTKSDLHYPFGTFAVWFSHLIDKERLKVQYLIEEQLDPLAIPYDILSQEVSGVSELLSVFDMRPQASLIDRAFSTTKDHGSLAYSWAPFESVIEDLTENVKRGYVIIV